jgi:hypothetical protein
MYARMDPRSNEEAGHPEHAREVAMNRTSMTRTHHIPLLALAILVPAGCGDGLALLGPTDPELTRPGSSPKFTDASFKEAICEHFPGEVRVIGNGSMIQIRDVRNENKAESDDPRYTGTNTHEFSAHVNLKTGTGIVRGRFTFRPETVAGTWEGTLQAELVQGLAIGRVVARGTGALRGQTLISDFEQVRVAEEDRLCPTPSGLVPTHFVGTLRIIDPGA